MDYFKIFNIVFMIFTTYLLYKLYADKCYKEGFEGTQQSLGGVDDTNAINTLAQIAKNLMTGGVTVPGAMNVTGGVTTPKGTGFKVTSSSGQSYGIWGGGGSGFASDNGLEIHTYNPNGSWAGNPLNIIGNDTRINGNQSVAANQSVAGNLTVNGVLNPSHSVWHTSTDGKHRIHYGNNSHSYYKTADAHVWRNRDDTDRMVLDHGANLRVDGGLTVQGRNILGELNNLNAKTANLNLGNYTIGPEGPYLVIRTQGSEGRWAYRTGTNWG